MKTSTIVLIAVVALFALLGMNGCSTYNSMITEGEKVIGQWQQVENQYQRRLDLIPNIVSTVQGEAEFEKSTLTGLVEARAKATSIQINPEKLDAASLAKFQEAQAGLSSSLGRLLAVAESYPTLQTNKGFSELRTELEGCENRISNERMKFNEMTIAYNTRIQKFPAKLWASIFGFEKKIYFASDKGAEKAPTVKFDFKK